MELTSSVLYIPNDRPAEGKNDPRYCTEVSLRGHFLNDHLGKRYPGITGLVGVGEYDLGVAKIREINFDWVVRNAYSLLGEDDQSLLLRLHADTVNYYGLAGIAGSVLMNLGIAYPNVFEHKAMIVRNLIRIEQVGLSKVDWTEAARNWSTARDVTLDLSRHSLEDSFPVSKYFQII